MRHKLPNAKIEDDSFGRESSGEIYDTVNLQREAKYAVRSLPPPATSTTADAAATTTTSKTHFLRRSGISAVSALL